MTVSELVKQLLTITNQELEVYVKDNPQNVCSPVETVLEEMVTTLDGTDCALVIGGQNTANSEFVEGNEK